MSGDGPDAERMDRSPIADLVISRMLERGWKLEDRAAPMVRDGAPRSTLHRYMQPDTWLRSGLRPATLSALARSLELDVATLRAAANESIDPERVDAAERLLRVDERSTTTDDHAGSGTDEAIRNDPTLSEEARAHLLNQLRLLRLLPPEAVTGEPTPRRRDHATPAEDSPVRPSEQPDRGSRATGTGKAARTAADAKASAGGKRPRAGAKER